MAGSSPEPYDPSASVDREDLESSYCHSFEPAHTHALALLPYLARVSEMTMPSQ